jgi:hypothetical protein
MALIFRCAYFGAIRHGGAKRNELRDPRSGAIVDAMAVAVVADGALAVAWVAGGALVSDAMVHPRHPLRESLHHSPAHIRSIARRLCSSPLVLRILRSGATSQVGLRSTRSGRQGQSSSRPVVRRVSRGGEGGSSCSRCHLCRPPRAEWPCAICNRSRGVHVCHHFSNRSRGVHVCCSRRRIHNCCDRRGRSRGTCLFNDLPQSQAVVYHIRMQSRVVSLPLTKLYASVPSWGLTGPVSKYSVLTLPVVVSQRQCTHWISC